MPDPHTPTGWVQPSLIPIHWPLIELRQRLLIPADGSPTQVAFKIIGCAQTDLMIAMGIDWIPVITNEGQRAEVNHDLIRRALEHLTPFP